MSVCSCCKGSGQQTCPRCGGYGSMESGEVCYYCKGKKTIPCEPCDCKGYIDDDE